MLIKLGALVDDRINCGLAGVVTMNAPNTAPSTASESTSPAEEINSGFLGTSGRTSSRPPAKVRREDDWVLTMPRVSQGLWKKLRLRGGEGPDATMKRNLGRPVMGVDSPTATDATKSCY